MDRKKVAAELLALARELVGMEFPTQDAMDKYLKDHPDADKSNHKVVETKKDKPAKKEKSKERAWSRELDDEVSTVLRDNLHGSGKVVTEAEMRERFNTRAGMKINKDAFKKIWDSMVEDEYLQKTEGGYKWNDEGAFTEK